MPPDRAQTYVDVGSARVGNAGITRTFSAFLGPTVGLRLGSAGAEWVPRQAPELSITVDGTPKSCMQLGGASWSEEAHAHAATLTGEYDDAGLVVQVRTTALHEAPALLREMSVHNYTAAPVTVSEVVVDALLLQASELRLGPDWTTRVFAHAGPGETPVLLAGPSGGLAWGMAGTGLFALRTEDPALCAVTVPGTWTLAPGSSWRSPASWMVAYVGPVSAATPALGAFRLAWRAMQAWETERAATREAESRQN